MLAFMNEMLLFDMLKNVQLLEFNKENQRIQCAFQIIGFAANCNLFE